jgi:hypothetical protein
LAERSTPARLHAREAQQLLAVVEPERVGPDRRGADLHDRLAFAGEALGDLFGDQHQRGGAIADGRHVEQLERPFDVACTLVGGEVDLLVKERVRVAVGVEVRVDRERRKHAVVDLVGIHVRLHQACIERHEGRALAAFLLPIRGGGERTGDAVLLRMGHALEAAHDHDVVRAALDRHHARADGCAAGAAGGLDG